jgi:hypothetical protein
MNRWCAYVVVIWRPRAVLVVIAATPFRLQLSGLLDDKRLLLDLNDFKLSVMLYLDLSSMNFLTEKLMFRLKNP